MAALCQVAANNQFPRMIEEGLKQWPPLTLNDLRTAFADVEPDQPVVKNANHPVRERSVRVY